MDQLNVTPAAIDFKKLLREERKKAREERRRQRLAAAEQEQGEAQNDISVDNKDDNDKMIKSTETDDATNNGSAVATKNCTEPAWNHHSDAFLHNDAGSPARLDLKRHVVCPSNPAAIYYIPNFVSTEYQEALSEWLLQLPENNGLVGNNNSKQQRRLLSLEQQEEQAMGCWTTMTYAQRRVALFDNRPQQPKTINMINGESTSSNNRSRRGFPEPLASLARHISKFCAEIMPPSTTSNSYIDNDHQEQKEQPQTSSISACMINHILINDYFSSHQGIMPHTDGPAYQPLTATLSLKSSAILHFTPRPQPDDDDDVDHKTNKNERSVVLKPGSLVIFHEEAYSDYMHSIRSDYDDDSEVVSETCVNTTAGTRVERGPQRLSLTFRVKK